MSRRGAALGTVLAWPAGLVLVLAGGAGLPVPVVAVVSAGYAVGVLALFRRLQAWNDPTAAALAASGPALFAAVGLVGPPTAANPVAYQVNTAALSMVAVILLVCLVQLAAGDGKARTAGRAAPALALFVIGTTLYLANLLARVAVVLSGAAQQQAAVEDQAWWATSYLRGLEVGPDFMAYLLVWLDLLQLAYVATAYLAAGAVARLLAERGQVSVATGRRLARAGAALAGLLVAGAVLAMILPRQLDLIPAWVAFVVSIPFWTTLLPTLLGVAILHRPVTGATPSTPSAPADRGPARRRGYPGR